MSERVREATKKGLKFKLPISLILLVVTCIVGYLNVGFAGIVWGILIWLCSLVAYVPFCGAAIFQFVLLPWIDSQIHVMGNMKLLEIVWIVYAWIKTVLMSIVVVLIIVAIFLARDQPYKPLLHTLEMHHDYHV